MAEGGVEGGGAAACVCVGGRLVGVVVLKAANMIGFGFRVSGCLVGGGLEGGEDGLLIGAHEAVHGEGERRQQQPHQLHLRSQEERWVRQSDASNQTGLD